MSEIILAQINKKVDERDTFPGITPVVFCEFLTCWPCFWFGRVRANIERMLSTAKNVKHIIINCKDVIARCSS